MSNGSQPALINLHPNTYSLELCYFSFAVNLDKCIGSCNTFNYISNRVCVLNKTEDLSIHVFDKVTSINE